MLIEMSIKGLMVDPVTNMPIVLLRDADEPARAADLGRAGRGQRDRAADRERRAAAADDARPAAQPARPSSARRSTRVVISDLRESTFYAYLELERGGETSCSSTRGRATRWRSRIRTRAPVFVDTRVLDQARSVEVSTEQADQERLQRWLESLDPDDLGYKM